MKFRFLSTSLLVVVCLLPHVAFGIASPPGKESVPRSPQPQKPAGSSPTPNVVGVPYEVFVLHASNAGGGIEGRIGNLPQLKKPPFSSYDTYRLLTQTNVSLTPNALTTTALPDGGSVSLTLKDPTRSEHRRIALSIQKPNGSTFLPLLEVNTKGTDPFFVAGYHHQKGILVVGVKLAR